VLLLLLLLLVLLLLLLLRTHHAATHQRTRRAAPRGCSKERQAAAPWGAPKAEAEAAGAGAGVRTALQEPLLLLHAVRCRCRFCILLVCPCPIQVHRSRAAAACRAAVLLPPGPASVLRSCRLSGRLRAPNPGGAAGRFGGATQRQPEREQAVAVLLLLLLLLLLGAGQRRHLQRCLTSCFPLERPLLLIWYDLKSCLDLLPCPRWWRLYLTIALTSVGPAGRGGPRPMAAVDGADRLRRAGGRQRGGRCRCPAVQLQLQLDVLVAGRERMVGGGRRQWRQLRGRPSADSARNVLCAGKEPAAPAA
jgi:hypothetical protein